MSGKVTDWNEIHRRVEAAREALERRAMPSAEDRKRILKERAQVLAREPAAEKAAHEQLEVVEFLLAHERYAVASSFVREVYPLKEFTALPGLPPYLLGVVNVRGQILSVIDLKKFFDLPEKGLVDLNKVVVAYLVIAALQSAGRDLFEKDFAAVEKLVELRADLNRQRAIIEEMILTAEPAGQQALQRDLIQHAREADELMNELLELFRDNTLFLRRLQELEGIRGEYAQTREEQIRLIREGRIEEARELGLGVQSDRYEQMRAIELELSDAAKERAAASLADSELKARQTAGLFAIVAAAVLVVSVLMTLFLSRSIADPLREMSGITAQVAAGDLSVNLKATDRADEVGLLTQNFARMTQSLRTMADVAESIVKLSEQSQAIGEIIATVGDLAEQSNLLAVNAAIEAAKAGEQGKGFAVVAQEIRSLAEQSKQATSQVRAILNDIQRATSAAVMATEQGSKAVAAGGKQSAEAGDAIRSLADSINEAAQAATQIAASSQQQLVGTDQVAMAMENIKQASTQNVAGTKQAEAAAHSLHDLGQKLKGLVEQYKV